MFFRYIFVFLLVLPSTSASAQLNPIPRFDLREDGVHRFKESLKDYDASSSPGFSLLVGTPDSILFKHQTGLANVKSKTKIEHHTPFYIASIGKTMTAFAVLKLREEEKLSLKDPLSKFLPGMSQVHKDVTIMHLLQHQSGIPDYYKILGDVSHLTNERIVSFVADLDSLDFAPGHAYAYSNTAYVLLAEIIEQISGISYAEYLSQTFFQPLGMKDTIVADSPATRPQNAAIGYGKTEANTWEIYDRETFLTGPGGIYSTADDLYLWYKALNSGKVVSKRWVELAFHMPSTLAGQVSYMAMGWFNETFGRRTPELEGLPVYGALGSYRGFRTMLYIFPQQEMVAILLENTGTYSLGGQEIANAFLEKK